MGWWGNRAANRIYIPIFFFLYIYIYRYLWRLFICLTTARYHDQCLYSIYIYIYVAPFHLFRNGQLSRSMFVPPPLFGPTKPRHGPEWTIRGPNTGPPPWARNKPPSWAMGPEANPNRSKVGPEWARVDPNRTKMGPKAGQSGTILGP